MACGAVSDGTQNVKRYRYFFPVPNIFDTDTGTFFGTKFFRYRFRDLFSNTKFYWYRFRDFFQYQMFPIPVPRLIPGTIFFRYRFRDFFHYHFVLIQVPIPKKQNNPCTGNSRYRYVTLWYECTLTLQLRLFQVSVPLHLCMITMFIFHFEDKEKKEQVFTFIVC